MHKPKISKPTSKPQSNAMQKQKPRGPFFEDDEDDAPAFEGQMSPRPRERSKPAGSQPLGELSQEQQNSQRHGSQPSQKVHARDEAARSPSLPQKKNSDASSILDTGKQTAELSQSANADQEVSQQKEEQISNAIAHLLAAKQRRSVSGDQLTAQARPHDLLGRRKRGTLGRAASAGSYSSLRADSVGSSIDQDERREPVPLPDPSQKIIYEDEKAQEERRALIVRMGGQVDLQEEEARRVSSIGMVKDGGSTSGVGAGGRGKRKR
jgi:hypothetical protein